jgi:hypothetical protein
MVISSDNEQKDQKDRTDLEDDDEDDDGSENCVHRHFCDLPGLVKIQQIADRSRILEKPKLKTVCICSLTVPSSKDISTYDKLVSEFVAHLEDSVSQLSSRLSSLSASDFDQLRLLLQKKILHEAIPPNSQTSLKKKLEDCSRTFRSELFARKLTK